jgi:hypothetical protein
MVILETNRNSLNLLELIKLLDWYKELDDETGIAETYEHIKYHYPACVE